MLSNQFFQKTAETFGTPVYVYDESRIKCQLRRLFRHITYRPLAILYAVKANSNSHILKIIIDEYLKMGETVGIDAVSPGEVALILKAGVLPENILFTGNNTTDEEINFVVEKGVLPNIDSLSRLEKFGQKYPGHDVCVRINPDVGDGHHDHCITGGPESKFGIWYLEVGAIKKITESCKLKIIGVHQHIGSQTLDPDKFLFAMEVMLRVARNFPDLKFIDFGGGLGVPYKPEEKPLDVEALGAKMSSYFAEFCEEYNKPLRLVIEPGRYLVAEAGFLLVQVTTIKKNPDGRIFIGVDSGFNHLDRPARYGSWHQIVNISNPTGPEVIVDIVGNLCESGDKFAVQRKIAGPREGDLLVINNAGAYGYSMSSNYNLRPRPPEVLVKGNGDIIEIRKRETIEQLLET